MEISFILTAVRRRWPIIVASLLLGLVVAFTVVDDPVDAGFRSEALLQITPPPSASGALANNPDRFINGELSLLRTPELAAQVAEEIGGSATGPSVQRAMDFEQLPSTNVVAVRAESDDPARARALAATYAEVYLERTASLAETTLGVQLLELNERINSLVSQIEAIDRQYRDAVAPYLDAQTGFSPPPIPSPQVLLPEAWSRRELLMTEHDNLLDRRQQLEEEQRSFSASYLLQPATEAVAVPVESPLPVRAAIVVVSLLLGLSLAVLATRFWKRIVDERDAESVLGRRFVARFPWSWQRYRSPLRALDAPPRSHREEERRLVARVDRMGPLDSALVVAVTGVSVRSGTTTTALALARRFAASGRHTVLVDGNEEDPWLSDVFSRRNGTDIESVLRGDNVARAMSVTGEDNLSVLGRAPSWTAPMRREDVLLLMGTVANYADVVVVDAGTCLSSATATEACAAAHAVVLAVPLRRTLRVELEEVAAALADDMGRVLPVVTRPSWRRGAVDRVVETERREEASPPAHHDEWAPDPPLTLQAVPASARATQAGGRGDPRPPRGGGSGRS